MLDLFTNLLSNLDGSRITYYGICPTYNLEGIGNIMHDASPIYKPTIQLGW
jgi:hypothetical protein